MAWLFPRSWLRRFFTLQKYSSPHRQAALRLETLENRTVMAVSLNQAFIASAYQGLLGRPADAFGFACWSQQLDGGASRTDVISGITASDEYHRREVVQVYQTYLNRNPEAAGLAY